MTSAPSSNTKRGTTDGDRRPPIVVLLLGIGLMSFSALRVVWLAARHDPQVHVPVPVAYVLAFVMLTGSAMALLKVLGYGDRMQWLALPLILGMAVTFGWVGLYGDERYCSSKGPPWVPLPSCHTAFTGAAVLMLLMAAVGVRGWWRQRSRGTSG
jgi:hypothetical protein